MIAYVRAFSRLDAVRLLSGQHPEAKSLARLFAERTAWVAIANPGGPTSPAARVRVPHLLLHYRDVDPDVHPLCFALDPMRPEHADAIVAFVRRLHARPVPVALYVHCEAGHSRSAAVARWVQDVYKPLTGREFERLHPRIKPNAHGLRLLREAAARADVG